jgi:flagellar biosynthesis protein FliR
VFDLEQLARAVVLTGMRITGVLMFCPFLGNAAVPPRVKASIGLVLIALLYPALPRSVAFDLIRLPQIILTEFVVGALLGLALQLVFEAVAVAGNLLGIQMGFSLVNILDPQSQVETPVLSLFYEMVAILIFIRLDAHYWLLRGLARSFSYLPPGTFTLQGAAVEYLLRQAGGIWLAAIQIAAPVLAVTMAVDLTLAFVGKAAPQLPVLFVGMSVKSMLGLVMLIATLATWPSLMERYFSRAVASGERLLHLAN